MIRNELYKIISNRTAVLLAALILLLNIVFQVYVEQNDNRYNAASYNALWEDLEKQAEEEGAWDGVAIYLAERLEVFSETPRTERESLVIYTDSFLAERALFEDVYEEISFQADYPGYLKGVDEYVDTFMSMSIFGKVDGYSHKDLLKMKAEYAGMERKELIPEQSAGMEVAASTGVTDILALVLILFVVVMLWLKEREQNMLLLIRTTYNGRIKLAVSKLTVLIFTCAFAGVGLYGSNALVGAIMYGLGDLSRPLATVYDYGHTLWEISAGEFLILNVVFKIIAYIWVGLLMSVLCCKFTNSAAAFGTMIILGATGCLMYYKIFDTSVWKTFKYLNAFGVLKTELIFMAYRGLNILGTPVEYRVCMAIVLPAGLMLFVLLTIVFFTDYVIKGRKRAGLAVVRRFTAILVGLRRITERHTGLLLHELHRIFVCHKGIVVAVIVVLFVLNDAKPYEISYLSYEQYYEQMYLEELQGPVTEEKLAYIESEEERVARPSSKSEQAQKEALGLIGRRISYIEKNEGAYFIYEEPHNRLVADYGQVTDLLRAFIALIPVVLIMPYFFAPDLQTGVNRITNVTLHGRKRLKAMRYITGIVFAFAIAALAHISYFVQIMVSYGVEAEVFSYPVNSIPHLADFGNTMSLGTYYAIIYMLKILATVIGAFLVYALSRLLKSQAYTMLAGFLLMVAPFLVAMYDTRIIYAAYPFSVALGNLFVQERGAMVTCVITVVIVTVILWSVNRKRATR